MGGGMDLRSWFFCVVGSSFFLVAFGFWRHRGGDACIFVARPLVVARRAVVGGRRWTRTLACRGTNLRLHRLVATSVLRGLPAFYRSGAFCAFPAFLSSRLAFGADGVGHGTAGRAAVGICVDRRDARAAGGGVVGSCGRTAPLRARALGGFFSPPARVEAHLTASQCWKTVRVRHGGVLWCG